MKKLQEINIRRFNALIQNLSPVIIISNMTSNLSIKNSEDLFKGKLPLFLTCWAVSRDLKNILNEADSKFFEELSLKCVYKSLNMSNLNIWQLQLLIKELPNILKCDYPIVKDIKNICMDFIPKLMEIQRIRNDWKSHEHLDYILKLLNVMN